MSAGDGAAMLLDRLRHPVRSPGHATGPARHAQAGLSLPEVLLALLIMATVAAVMVSHLSVNLKSTVAERDRVFAYSKAQGILAEIQSFVGQADGGDDQDIDSLDDGIVNTPTLTIARDEDGDPVLPDDVLSGNWQRGGEWIWSRRISVQPLPGVDNRNVRYVTVRIFQRDGNGVEREAANLSALVNAPGAAFPTTQVFDLYLLAIENIPGWWVFMDTIRPFVESTITDLETRNPGLEVRTHWITKSSFGRNPVYRPYVNDQNDSLQPIPDVYFYPGKMPDGSASTYYYVPSNIKGRIAVDGVEQNGYHADLNPHPYTLADFFNHAMRQPEEMALWQARKDAIEDRERDIAVAKAAGMQPPPELDDMSKEPTLRLFLDDLCRSPQSYKNALIINLHGELLPMPALRNYSDAARDPVAAPEVRVVTHSERIRTPRAASGPGTEPARFRVYAYTTNVAAGPSVAPTIALEVPGLDLTDPSTPQPDLMAGASLQNLRGGVSVGGTTNYFPFAASKVLGDPSLLAGEMHYEAALVTPADGSAPFTRILLHNTPCVAPSVGGRGLSNDQRSMLYGMAYQPSPCSSTRDFAWDLYSAPTGSRPKNSARWTLEIPASVFTQERFLLPSGAGYDPGSDVVLAVRTRIWTGPEAAGSGVMWPAASRNAPENLSTTYTWWCDSIEDVPVTERSQFFGDPRHCPYRDLMRPSQSGDPDHPAPSPDFADGYNWFFDSLNNGNNSAQDYRGLASAKLANLWRGRVGCDVPRLLETLRQGLVESNCVYTTLTGFSYYYLGVGNDIGYDSANGYPNSIPCDQTPFGTSGGSGFVNTITGARTLVRDGSSSSSYWWGMPWLGELYPDAAAADWLGVDAAGVPRGNLRAGSGSGRFRQLAAQTVHGSSSRAGYGTRMTNSQQRLQEEGCTSFFNTGTSSSTFHHQFSSGTGSLTSSGDEIAQNYNFNMPTTAPISRPFGLQTSGSGTVGTEWNSTPYSSNRYPSSLRRMYYNHPSGNVGSGLVELENPARSDSAFLVVNGIDRTVESGSNFIAKYAVLSLVHSFFEAGNTAVAHRIPQPVRVEIVQPTDVSELIDPSQIDIVFETSWRRWDGLPYTAAGSATEDESELEYLLTYSSDGGETWRHVRTGALAVPGERPDDASLLLSDTGPGQESFSWTVSDLAFPQGSYYLRVDCFRRGAPIHFSYHKTKLFIQR